VAFEHEHDLARREIDAVVDDAGLGEVERRAGWPKLLAAVTGARRG
jgi:hypothetical protein